MKISTFFETEVLLPGDAVIVTTNTEPLCAYFYAIVTKHPADELICLLPLNDNDTFDLRWLVTGSTTNDFRVAYDNNYVITRRGNNTPVSIKSGTIIANSAGELFIVSYELLRKNCNKAWYIRNVHNNTIHRGVVTSAVVLYKTAAETLLGNLDNWYTCTTHVEWK